jgi:acetyl esterase
MHKTELHPIIAELLHTKYNEDDRVCSNISAYRLLFNDFVHIISYLEAYPVYVYDQEIIPTNVQIPKFNIRIYQEDLSENKPVLVYFHGGNWIAGNLQTCDALCSAIALESNYVVISVDYALAPEYCYPTPLHQGLEVIDWIKQHGINHGMDYQKIVVGGDNAGGNIAAGLVHLLEKTRRIKLFGQLLICPVLYYVFDSPSFGAFGKGFLLSKKLMCESWKTYRGHSDNRFSEFASPRLVADVSHVPATLIFTAGYDPLQDEAGFYAGYLKRQGIPVNFHCFEGVTHHFWLMNLILDIAIEAYKRAIEFLICLNKSRCLYFSG